MDLGIRGRRALVAGGSAGMGRATARALAAEGAEIVLSARGEDRLRAAAAEIAAETGARVTPVAADHSTEAGREALLAACPAPDILVVTIAPPGAIDDYRRIREADWLASVQSGMVGPAELIRMVSDGMVERRWGRIVSIATIAAKFPSETRLLSGPARAALINYTSAVARRLARHNVILNSLLPGMFLTYGVEAQVAKLVQEGQTREAAIEALAKQWRIPARRLGHAEDAGKLAATLCAEHAGYLVGQSLVVDGGMTPGMF